MKLFQSQVTNYVSIEWNKYKA